MTHKIIILISLTACISNTIRASEPADDLEQEYISAMAEYVKSHQPKVAQKIIFSSSSAFKKPQPQSAFIISAGAASAAQVVASVSAAAPAVPQTDLKQSAEQPLTPNQALPIHLRQWLYEPVDVLTPQPQQHEELLQMFRISYIQQTVLASQQAQTDNTQAALKAGKAVAKAKTAAPQGYTKEYSLF